MKNKNFLKKLTAGILGFVMTLGVGAAGYAGAAGETRAAVPLSGNTIYNAKVCSFMTNNSYGSYTGSVASSGTTVTTASWKVTLGNSNNSGQLGSNDKQKAKMILSNGSVEGNAAVAAAIGKTVSATYVSAVIGQTAFNKVGKIEYSASSCNGTTVWLVYSTNNWSTATASQLSSKTSGSISFDTSTDNVKVAVAFYHTSYALLQQPNIKILEAQESGKTLTSISVSGSMTTNTYTDKDSAFVPDGLIATGHYDDNSSKDISSLVTWRFDPVKPTSTSLTSVNVYAKYDDIESEAYPQAITVTHSDKITITVDIAERAKTNNWTSGEVQSGWNEAGSTYLTFSQNGGGNNGKYYSSDDTWRFYNGGTLKITLNDSSFIIDSISSNPSKSFTIDGSGSEASLALTATTNFKSFTITLKENVVHEVTISGGASSVYEGGTTTFTASCDQDGCDTITWESSDTTIATVNNGKVTGIKAGGPITITASCAGGGSDSVSLTVQANALVLSPASITDAQKDGSGTITASLSGVSGETVTYTWSSNSEAVTVTGNTATAALAYNKGGDAIITCNATVNGITFTNTCSVTVVTEDPVVSFNNPPSTGYTGISYDFTASSANIENGEWSWKINGNDFSGDQLDDTDCSIISHTFTEAGSYTITATCTGDDDATATANTTIVITASSSVLTIDKNSIELQKGSEISITPTLVVTGSYADKTTITVTKEGGVTLDKSTTTSGSPVKVTAGSTGGVAKVIFSANGQDVECAIEIPSTTSDKIVSSDLTADGTTYSSFENVKKNTAVYAGSSSLPAQNQISLRSKNSDSGIITTTSGGIISKVTVTWAGTTDNRQLDVYGKNTAYESASDLFDSSKQGELIGTLNYKTVLEDETELSNNEIEIDGSYAYVGVRSRNNATTFSDITFVWIEPKAVESVTAGQDSISVAKGASSQLTWTVLPADASNKAVEFSMDPVLTGVTISDAGLVSADSTATVGATSIITIASKENSSIKDTVSFTVLPTYLDNSKALLRTGFTKFTTEQTFASVRGSSNHLEAQYIDGTKKNSKGDNETSMWANTKCYVNNGTSEEPNWVEYNMSSAITNADNGKWFKFVYSEDGYTQSSNAFQISVDNVTIIESITLYYSNSSSYAHSHDFTADDEYSATGAVTWSVVDAYSRASITQLGVLTIDGAPTNVGASMQFRVKAVCGACTRYCDVTLRCEPATSVTVDWPDTIGHNTSGAFTATVETEYARQAVCWTSSDEALTITGQSANKLKASWTTAELESDKNVTVTAFVDENGDETYTEGEAIATKTITIHAAEIPVTEVNITEEDIEIWQDDDDAVNKAQFTLHATVTEGASVQKAKWSIVEGSDNVVVSSGSIYEGLSKSWKFTGNAGTATIRATSMNKENEQVYDELTVTVKQSILSDISVDASASTVVKEFEKDHVITASDYSGLVVKATYQSGNESVVTPTSVSCDTSKVGTSTVVVSYTLNGVTKQDSYQVTIHAPSLNVVKKTVTESHTDPTEHDAGISSGEQLLNSGASIPSIEVDNPGYVVTKLQFTCRYNKTIDPAVTVEAKIGNTSLGSQTVGNNFDGTLIFENTTKATGQIVFSFTNHCTASSKCGTFYWTSLTMYDEGETIRTTTYSNNKMSDAMYAFIDKYSEDLSAGKWGTIFSSSEYAALSANDKALFKDGVVSGTDDSGTKTSSKEFADFINKYDEVFATNDGLINYLDRPIAQTYTISIDYNHDGQTSTVKVLPGDYKLPDAPDYSGHVFQGWTVGSEVKDAGSTITVTGNMTITANWAVGITFTNSAEFKFTGLTMERFQYVFEGTCPDDALKSGFLVSTTGDADLLNSLTDEQILAGNNEGVTEKNKSDNKLVIGTSDGSKTVSVMFYYVDANEKVVKSQVITMSFDSFVTADGFDPSIYEDPYAIMALQYYIAGLQAK